LILDELHNLVMGGRSGLRKCSEQIEYFGPVCNSAAGELADDKWMDEDVSAF